MKSVENNVRTEQEVVIAGERLILLPERAVLWPSRNALLVADVHLGKDATFRAFGIPMGVGATDRTLERLGHLIEATQPERLIFLGDLWHAKAGRTREAVDAFLQWRVRHMGVSMTLVEGNHDRRAGALPEGASIEEVPEPFSVGPFSMCHYPDAGAGSDGYCLAGHVHPSVVLRGAARQALRLPCFIFRPCGAILPAFGDFTGTATVDPATKDSVYVVAEDRVIHVK